jgi:hypothetical protein
MNNEKVIEIIRKSIFFDQKWYLSNNPDLIVAGVEPAEHYYYFGWIEGRDPSPLFSSHKYLENYIDVKQANINPLVHYEIWGKKEKRKIFVVL